MPKNSVSLAATLLVSLALAACGGGGGGGGGAPADPANGGAASPTPVPAPGSPNNSTGSAKPADPAQPDSQAAAHQVKLSWTAPNTREDNSPISMGELTGYEVYYFLDGSAPEDGAVQPVSGGSITSTEITVPTDGTYFFAVAAVDHSGLVSDLSNYVSVTLK